ncbi:membrane-associating domain-containing protein [Lipomyces tetrasporus]|uniref:Membrane-associating domain-containing protein n=1 Tax=Lipomyces tetrasporus TaxID=54092 RepID=A0AAD7VQ11_9ASCO|nr:membrane-associating domain-containing protein [Lipomyces tetrasporus]KAJ8097748.1 membrane-associating domain-containing protein [Lipomyces tetrasporus]
MGALFISNALLRSLLFVFLVITLGLTGSLIHDQLFGLSQVNFMMFASVFGLVFGVFYGFIALFLAGVAFPFAVAAVDFLVTVFAFSGATALAVALRVHSCSNNAYVSANKVAQGSSDRCRKAQADTAFMYFAFGAALFLLILSLVSGLRHGWGTIPSKRAGAATAPAAAPAPPTMTQV